MQHFIGNDFHTRYQVVAWIAEQTGEICQRRLEHEGTEVERVARTSRRRDDSVARTCGSRSAAFRLPRAVLFGLRARRRARRLSACHACAGRFCTTAFYS